MGKKVIWTFGTPIKELLQLQDWLTEYNCTDVAMGNTRVHRKPVPLRVLFIFGFLILNASKPFPSEGGCLDCPIKKLSIC